jgi:hypothetical protein
MVAVLARFLIERSHLVLAVLTILMPRNSDTCAAKNYHYTMVANGTVLQYNTFEVRASVAGYYAAGRSGRVGEGLGTLPISTIRLLDFLYFRG